MRRPLFALLFALCAICAICAIFAAPVSAAAQGGQPPVTGGLIAAEIAGGVAAMPLGFLGGGLATRWAARRFGADDETAGSAAMIGAYTTAVFVTAIPPTVIGLSGHDATGSYLAALAGSAVGGLGSFALVRLNRQSGESIRPCRVTCVLSFVGVMLLPSVGATVGFNLSRRYSHP